jgi:hypothetical protein
MQQKIGENLIQLVEVLGNIDVSTDKIEQNATFMQDSDGNIIEY